MSESYLISSILNDEDLNECKKLFESLEPEYAHQDYNLFDVERRNFSPSQLSCMQKLLDFSNVDCSTATYFLKYTEGSFARMHRDESSAMTIVTMIHSSEDLVGGESLINRKYCTRNRPANKYARRAGDEEQNPPYEQEIIPDCIKLKEGESAIYDRHLKHGVSYVHSGERLVMITWFNDKEKHENYMENRNTTNGVLD